jgi:hypothetical protein
MKDFNCIEAIVFSVLFATGTYLLVFRTHEPVVPPQWFHQQVDVR